MPSIPADDKKETVVTILRVGATQKYSDNWDQVFGGVKKAPASAAKKTVKKAAKKATTTKSAKKNSAAK